MPESSELAGPESTETVKPETMELVEEAAEPAEPVSPTPAETVEPAMETTELAPEPPAEPIVVRGGMECVCVCRVHAIVHAFVMLLVIIMRWHIMHPSC